MTSTMTAGPVLRERLTDAPVRLASGSMGDPGDAAPMPARHRVPTMLVERELNYLYWLAGQMPEGGRAVELGCFLGGSTAALVEGMRVTGKRFAPMPVYDAFLAPDSEAITSSWWMKPFGLRAGENFRARYEQVHASRMDRIVVREGWIPEGVDRAGEAKLYPEQGPIDLLFVDAAKSWRVHETILRTFVRHVKVGGVVVQQDFMDVQTPWLPMHMWQLRDVLRPLDAVRGTPSVSFECIADPRARVDEAWNLEMFRDAALRERTWAEIIEFWAGVIGADAAGFLHGHAAKLASMTGDAAWAARHARAYEAWSISSSSRDVYVTPTWADALPAMAADLERAGADARAVRVLAAESAVRNALPRFGGNGQSGLFFSAEVRRRVWDGVLTRLAQRGIKRIALYGAGSHTQWLLESWHACGVEIAGIIDDAPRAPSVRGVKVVTPDAAHDLLGGVGAIVPSSDAHEEAIVRRASALAEERGVPVIRVYTELAAPERPDGTAIAVSAAPASATLRRVTPKDLAESASYRAALGLPERRGWIEEFCRRTGTPEWVRGHVNYRDALLLWDLVEAVRPDTIVEVGTASGVSTGLLAAAGECFGGTRGPGASVWSFDIAARCYFDVTRPVGAAAFEIVPHLRERIHLLPGRTCIDAAGFFGVGGVDLAFIDGDHRHPAPTLDVLALLYAVRPGGWMILHDIELSEVAKVAAPVEWDVVTGAETLFHAWPFEKVQPAHAHPSLNNIGAIRLPSDPARAAEFLLEHLRLSWETDGALRPAIDAALARLTR